MNNLYLLIKKEKKNLYFTKEELSVILSAYSNNVSRGVWRDYAIDHFPYLASFSIYKHSSDQPFLKITKIKKNGKFLYNLYNRKKNLFKSKNFYDLINFLNKLPQIIKFN